jgi:N-methylhydantoinase B/oxoprolinase/acetone carboxylase alpha subunit
MPSIAERSGIIGCLCSGLPQMTMRTGERFIGSHGGGYGDPLARKPERLRDDVADGLLSGKTALRDYGLVADAGGEVDEVRTARVHAEWPP